MSKDDVVDSRTGEVIQTLSDMSPSDLLLVFNNLFPEFIADRDLRSPENMYEFPDPTVMVAKVARPSSPLEMLLHAERVNRERLTAVGGDFESPEDADDFDWDGPEEFDDFASQFEFKDVNPEYVKGKDGNYYDKAELQKLADKVKAKAPKEPSSVGIQTPKEEGGKPAPKRRKTLDRLMDYLDDGDD